MEATPFSLSEVWFNATFQAVMCGSFTLGFVLGLAWVNIIFKSKHDQHE